MDCKDHDVDYRKSKKDWDSFVEALNEKLAEKDETIPELPAKDLVSICHKIPICSRIYADQSTSF